MKRFLFGFLKVLLGLIVVLVVVWFAGPKADFDSVNPDITDLSISIGEIDSYLAEKEAKVANIKPLNESRVIWADSVRQTEYAIVYLHGFSAGPMEGAPLHQETAQRYGMNLYLPRLYKHGIDDDEIFTELTPHGLVESAKEAIAIGRIIGKKVIVMSCSTGGTLAAYLIAHNDVHAHITYAPNIDLFDPKSDMMTGPWGLKITKSILGDFNLPEEDPNTPDSVQAKIDQYWSGKYRVEGLVALQSLLDQTMKDEFFENITAPHFIGFYYKSDEAQDSSISVAAVKDYADKISTEESMKTVIAFEEAGSHVINSDLTSKQFEDVRAETFNYIEEVLQISAKE